MRTKLTFTLVLFSIILLAQGFKNVDLDEFNRIRTEKDAIVIDVRTRDEFLNIGHVENAVNIDVNEDDFETRIDTISKQKQIVLYCRSGARSTRAAKIFVNKGYTKVFNLEGGIISWERLLRSL